MTRLEPPRELIADGATLELLADGFRLTEGPVWVPSGGYLLFTDVYAGRIHRWDAAGGVTVWAEESNGANGLTLDAEERVIACEAVSKRLTRREHDGSLTVLADRFAGEPLWAPNDVVVARDGSVYFTVNQVTVRDGTLEIGPEGSLVLRVVPGAEPTRVAGDFQIGNGLGFSPDERLLYVSDTVTRSIDVVELRDGQPVGRRRFFDGIGDGRVDVNDPATRGTGFPDGLKVDERGNVYSCGPGGIWVISPAGEHLGVIPTPLQPKNLNWGDADFRTLYVDGGLHGEGWLARIRMAVAGAPASYMTAGGAAS